MKILSVLILIIIAPLFFLSLVLLSLKLTLFSPSFVKQELRENNAYSTIYKNLPELFATMGPKEGMEGEGAEKGELPSEQKAIFSAEETSAFFYNTIGEKDFQKKTELAIDSIWPWLFSGKELKPIPIADIRQKLSDNILAGFKKKYEALPDCKDPSEFKYDMKTCKIRGKGFDELLSDFLVQQKGNPSTQFLFAGNVPNEFDIEKFTQPNPQLNSKFAGAQSVRSKVSPILGNVYIVFPVLLAIIFLLSRVTAGSWVKAPRVFGIYTGVIALIFLIASFINTRLLFPWVIDFANGKIKTLPVLKDQLLMPLVKDILSKVWSTQMKIGVTFIVIGILLVVGSIILIKIIKRPAGQTLKPEEANKKPAV